jgi:hypothetical protein
MRVKSVIFSPLHGESLRSGEQIIRGVAWNDGVAAIEAVEVSLDRGATWRRTELERSASPYAWQHWQIHATLSAGQHVLLSRAVDRRGACQPLDGAVHWNPAGYAWNGVDEIEVTVS